jgi:hypothetical protein
MAKKKKSIWANYISDKPLYTSWCSMMRRCYYKKGYHYPWYGAKGVTICEEWQEYRAFEKWALEQGYKAGMVVSRIGDVGNYEPSNCKIVTAAENQYEASIRKRKPVICVETGKLYVSASEAARRTGIQYIKIKCAANPNHNQRFADGYQWRYI